MTAEARRPFHLGVALGISAGVYAVSLAGVTALQAGNDRALAADHRPASDAVNALRVAHDSLDADLTRARNAYQASVERYQNLTKGVGTLDSRLGSLAGQVTAISSVDLRLPTFAPVRPGGQAAGSGYASGVATSRSASAAQGSRSGSAPLPALPAVPAAAPAAPPPPVHACTTASGQPC